MKSNQQWWISLCAALESGNDMPRDYFQTLLERRQQLEKNATPSEMVFFWRLRQSRIPFGFQVLIPPYIADFVILKRMLVIEIDGSSHEQRADYDERRTAYLTRRGFAVLRLKNDEVSTWPLGLLKKFPRVKGGKRLLNNLVDQFKRDGFGPAPPKRAASHLIKQAKPIYLKCSCGTKAILYGGDLGPHLKAGKGDPCPYGKN